MSVPACPAMPLPCLHRHGFEASSPRAAVDAMDTMIATTNDQKVLAILDTGASRCVMGADLLPKFLKQLGSGIREQIRVVPSQVRFWFGNNQTLTSEKRMLLPLSCSSDRLWLGVEVVPGGTPLLFSKKALKQLGAIVDMSRDTCYLKRLRRDLPLTTGPTGLYLIDLAHLCDESQGSECLAASEDVSLPVRSDRTMHVSQNLGACCSGLDLGSDADKPGSSKVHNSTFSSKPTNVPESVNARNQGFPKIPVPINRAFRYQPCNSPTCVDVPADPQVQTASRRDLPASPVVCAHHGKQQK